MAPTSDALTGECACGAIHFTSSSATSRVTRCHCHTCQKIAGSDFMCFGGFKRADVVWSSEGKESTNPLDIPNVKHLSLLSFTHRGSCEKCSSGLFMYYDFDPEEIGICLSMLSDASAKRITDVPQSDIFVADKAPWHKLDKDSRKFDAFNDKFQDMFDKATAESSHDV